MARRRGMPGSIYRNGSRWWWSVRLPGEAKRRARPLVPPGGTVATPDRRQADEIARELYARALAGERGEPLPQISLGELRAAYLVHAAGYYRDSEGRPTGEYANVRGGLAVLEPLAALPVADFTPRRLKAVRASLIARGLARTTINARVRIIRRMYRWAAAEELVPASTYHALAAVEGLRAGRSDARERSPVTSVPLEDVAATTPYLPATVAAMVKLQLLTGMRPGEVCNLCPADIDRTGGVWWYRVRAHKTRHHGHRRAVAIGPQAQAVLAAYLDGLPEAPCFCPAAAQSERAHHARMLRRSPVPRSNWARGRRGVRRRRYADRYDSRSYYRAVCYGQRSVNRIRAACGEPPVAHWHPHQLRHTAAELARRAFGDLGRDAARALLGQRSLGIADRYSAGALDESLARQVAERIG